MDAYKHFGITGQDASGKPCFASIGTNYKLSDLQAAVGVVQMQHIDELMARSGSYAELYGIQAAAYR